MARKDQADQWLAGNRPRLGRLILNHTRVTDAGLATLGSMPQLQRIYLMHTGITDAGLEPLKKTASLKLLDLTGTQLGPAARNDFRQALGGRYQVIP